MKPVKIVAVSYLNTLPFVYGLKESGMLHDYELSLEVPSLCAKKLFSEEADIALIPVAGLHNRSNYKIVSDYCIGCDGPVKTVLLLSHKPIQEIDEIYLDIDSLTSVNLIKILCREYWKVQPTFIPITDNKIPYTNYESIVAIGDKTFSLKNNYPYVYDLGQVWKQFTGLPFVFACWVSKHEFQAEWLNGFNNALQWGTGHIAESIDAYASETLISQQDSLYYLQHDISFLLDNPKRQAIKLFLKFLKEGV